MFKPRKRADRWDRFHGDVEFINPNICLCSPKIPKPDPAIGEAAKQNADIAASMRDIAKDQLAWERERAATQDPLIERVVNQQIESGDQNAARADEQWQIYRDLFQPVEQRMVQDAMEFDSPERKERMAAEAGADITKGYQGTLDQQQRQMGRIGVNPNSARFQGLINETGLNQAKDTAGAMNKARRDTELLGLSQRQSVANFGRNMPNTGLAADAAALQGGNSAVGNLNQSNAARNASMATAQNWFGGSMQGNNSAGNLLLNQHQNQMQAWQLNQDRLAGLGQLAGMGGSMALSFLRKGGMVRNGKAYNISPGGLGMLRRKGYAAGGMIEGPGTGTSDSVPATIEGRQPIRVSNGEAVLNTGAVELIGEDAVHRLNAGGLMLLEAQKGGMQ